MISPALDPSNYKTRCDMVEHAYEIFKNTIMVKDNRNFKGKQIYINLVDFVDDKPDIFWHVIGIEDDQQITVHPCVNDFIYLLCSRNCDKQEWLIRTVKKDKIVCLYRAARIKWINETLILANQNDPRIKIWDKNKRIFIRYEYELNDFVIILEKMDKYRDSLKFVTAYPVFLRSQKINFDRDYVHYLKYSK